MSSLLTKIGEFLLIQYIRWFILIYPASLTSPPLLPSTYPPNFSNSSDSDEEFPSEAESCGKFYLGADGLYGLDAGIQADKADNCFGSYTEENFVEEDGVCKFELGKDLTW